MLYCILYLHIRYYYTLMHPVRFSGEILLWKNQPYLLLHYVWGCGHFGLLTVVHCWHLDDCKRTRRQLDNFKPGWNTTLDEDSGTNPSSQTFLLTACGRDGRFVIMCCSISCCSTQSQLGPRGACTVVQSQLRLASLLAAPHDNTFEDRVFLNFKTIWGIEENNKS